MIIKKLTTKEMELDITAITLLSKEEYLEFRDNIPLLDRYWWLCSPGYDNYRAACVYGDYGYVYDDGFDVNNPVSVRPALKISNLKSSDLLIGDKFSLRDKTWTIISETYALCDNLIGEYCFRRDLGAEDANDYESSDVKSFIENWWKNQDSHN